MVEEYSLYFHIPFCKRKCDYCHFYVIPDKQPFKEELKQGFLLEWKSWQHDFQGKTLRSIYFGGGTPYLLGPEAIAEILSWINPQNLEITLEANPEDVTEEGIKAYKNAGINRISLGAQSFNDSLLKTLSRNHSAERAKDAVLATYNAGISNISIDLMYDLPGQSLTQWEDTLTQAVDLPITHLSLYNLTIEPQTVFFKYRDKINAQMPLPEESLKMYQTAQIAFKQAGFEHYEISAFSKPGCPSIHNTGYWTGRPFIGMGPSAFSFWEGKRFRNIAHLHKWSEALKNGKSPIDFEEQLSPLDSQKELFAIRLRMLDGLDLSQYTLDSETFKIINHLIEQGYLLSDNKKLKLTDNGVLFYDSVASDII